MKPRKNSREDKLSAKRGKNDTKPSKRGDSKNFREKKSTVKSKDFINEDRTPNRQQGKRLGYKPKKKQAAPAPNPDGLIRLNRYLASAGIASRRKADELITAGLVSINGEVITEMGHKVKPDDVVRFNDESIKPERFTYVLLNKPKDYITTLDDPQERKKVVDLVKSAGPQRIFPVGRLDRHTMGLLLLTNDGDLAEKLAHPRNRTPKVYYVTLNKNLKEADMEAIANGITLDDGLIKVDEIAYVEDGSRKEIGVEIHSGKNRIIRRIFEHLGYQVAKLDRVIYANLTKKDLKRGKWRFLTEKEIINLKHLLK